MSGGSLRRVVPAYAKDRANYPLIYRFTGLAAAVLQPDAFKKHILFGWMFYNPNSSDAFVKVYDENNAPTVGTTTPCLGPIQVPALGSVVLAGADMVYSFNNRMYFAAVTSYLDTGTVAPATGLAGHIWYL